MMRREIMGRLTVVEEELGVIDGNMDDLPSRDAEIDHFLGVAKTTAAALRELLVERGWR